MSADNWDTCPQCAYGFHAEAKRARLRAEATYGQVPPADYNAGLEAVQRLEKKALEPGPTMREDYELQVLADGSFCVRYRASCDVCGFDFQFSHDEAAFSPPR